MRQTLGMMLCAILGLAAAAEISGAEVLVWHDEFEGETLDLSKWTAETGLVRNDRAAHAARARRAAGQLGHPVLGCLHTHPEQLQRARLEVAGEGALARHAVWVLHGLQGAIGGGGQNGVGVGTREMGPHGPWLGGGGGTSHKGQCAKKESHHSFLF